MTTVSTGRLAAALVVGAMAWAVPSAATLTMLLPARLAEIAPDGKVQLLAAAAVCGSIAALVAAILFGALSDLTRSRFGSRAPWMVAGGLAAGCCLLGLASAREVGVILVLWVLLQIAMNALIAPLKAILADRVAPSLLGRISSLYGAATLTGFAIGTVLGAQFLTNTGTGFAVAAAVFGLLPAVSAALAGDASNIGVPRLHAGRWSVLRAMAPPRGAPDFYWALGGRFAVMLGSSMITTFQLYILTDYIGLDAERAGGIVTIAAVLNLAAAIAGGLVSGAISDLLMRRKAPVVVASIIIATAMAFPALIPQSWAILVFASLVGLGTGIYYAVDVALMTEVLPNRAFHSRDLGILNISNTGGQILGSGVSSLIIAVGIGFAPVFIVAMAVTLVGGASTRAIKAVR